VLAVEEAVEGADVVITCTASREPLVRAEWLDPRVHVTALGSDGVGKQELEPEILGGADLVVADSREQCARLGELQHVHAAGMVRPEQVVELGEVVTRPELGRTRDDQTTVCDLTGVGVQDVAAANVVMEHALAEGMGERLAL
jgi:ornithine cyclodeaminase/alanine dehydrogenase-like protein (mu-crystallin family)